jgi:hypothetical protein
MTVYLGISLLKTSFGYTPYIYESGQPYQLHAGTVLDSVEGFQHIIPYIHIYTSNILTYVCNYASMVNLENVHVCPGGPRHDGHRNFDSKIQQVCSYVCKSALQQLEVNCNCLNPQVICINCCVQQIQAVLQLVCCHYKLSL